MHVSGFDPSGVGIEINQVPFRRGRGSLDDTHRSTFGQSIQHGGVDIWFGSYIGHRGSDGEFLAGRDGCCGRSCGLRGEAIGIL